MLSCSKKYVPNVSNLIFLSTFFISLTTSPPPLYSQALYSKSRAPCSSKNSLDKANALFHNIFKNYQLCSDIDSHSIQPSIVKIQSILGQEKLIEKIAVFIEKNRPFLTCAGTV